MNKHTDVAIPAGEFKARCLHIMDEVNKSRQAVIITKRGKPVVRLVPVEAEIPKLFGKLKGSLTILTDITLPIDEKWNANE